MDNFDLQPVDGNPYEPAVNPYAGGGLARPPLQIDPLYDVGVQPGAGVVTPGRGYTPAVSAQQSMQGQVPGGVGNAQFSNAAIFGRGAVGRLQDANFNDRFSAAPVDFNPFDVRPTAQNPPSNLRNNFNDRFAGDLPPARPPTAPPSPIERYELPPQPMPGSVPDYGPDKLGPNGEPPANVPGVLGWPNSRVAAGEIGNLPFDLTSRMGAHADWDKYQAEQRPSANVEDDRNKPAWQRLGQEALHDPFGLASRVISNLNPISPAYGAERNRALFEGEEHIGMPGTPLGPQPGNHAGQLLEIQPLSPDNPTELRAPMIPGAMRGGDVRITEEAPNVGLRGNGERTGGVEKAPVTPPSAGEPALPNARLESQLIARAKANADTAAAGRQPLEGLPQEPVKAAGYYIPGPNGQLHDIAEQYMREQNLPYDPPTTYAKVDRERAENIAQEFEDMRHNPSDPQVAASYEAMIRETMAQYQAIKKAGIKIDFIQPGQPNPYEATPRLAAKDLQDNNHLWVFPTESGFGTTTKISDNPLLRDSGERLNGQPMTNNDVFRVVHDVFGHFKDGNGFRATGEENAWRSHSAMYSDVARPAMTSETRGQNSWVNFGPHGEANRTASGEDTHYADQKIGLLPDWVVNEGRYDPGGEPAPQPSPYIQRGVDNSQRNDYPGIYDNPRLIAARAAANVAPEHPALKALFGVTRDDLYNIGQQGARPGNIDPQYKRPANPKGSYVSDALMNPINAQRLQDINAEAMQYPQLSKGMLSWYVMDPAYRRLAELHGPEVAQALYNQYNIVGGMHSPGSNVETELNRGTAANSLINSGDWARESLRWADPRDPSIMGHPYGGTAQAKPVNALLRRGGQIDPNSQMPPAFQRNLDYSHMLMTKPKVPLYIQASGVPETGFQTTLPVPDAHWTRGVGAADVRTSAKTGASIQPAEYHALGPWYRENVAKPLGIEAVPSQALQWGALGHATGVETQIGAPKLEILAKKIWERAQQLGIDPKVLRDQVLSGQGHVRLETPNVGAA